MVSSIFRPRFLVSVCLFWACQERPDLQIRGNTYHFEQRRPSSGQQFDIDEYVGDEGQISLVVPRPDKTPVSQKEWDEFAKLYTLTFSKQQFKMSSVGNRHLGVRATHVVYLTAAPLAKALSILLVERKPQTITTQTEAEPLFAELGSLTWRP